MGKEVWREEGGIQSLQLDAKKNKDETEAT